MKKYIFYTTDGYTFDSEFNEVENCQLLGFGVGRNIREAFVFLQKNEQYMQNKKYENIIACEIIAEPIRFINKYEE